MTSPGASSPDTIVFDDNGDLWLTVGSVSSSKILHVDSNALCRASKVFRAMLRGRFSDSKPANSLHRWEVKLPEDNPEAFVVLMDIVHANFDHAPFGPKASRALQHLRLDQQIRHDQDAAADGDSVVPKAQEHVPAHAVEEMLQDIAEKCHVDEFGSLLIDRNTRLSNLETFRLIPLIDPIAQHRVKMLQVFHAEGKEIAIKILAKRPLCWHTGPCSAVSLADGIPEKFIQATQDLGIDSFFMPSLNADQLGYRGSVSRLHRLFKEVEKLAFGEHHPHYCRHMEMLVDQACKIEMTAFMGSDDKAILEDEDSEDDGSSGFRSLSVDARY
ncbi:nuclear pore [Fusarium acutatum]|uniref:Nuclear pore n=1 Tax=Fusarium acutatum TaxID=78861 RepID=A0A8H4JNU2_9HYPO|nr:nuclear pore [Fusarium acutatum]